MAIKENPKLGLINYLNVMIGYKYGYQKFKVIDAAPHGADDAIFLKSYEGNPTDDELKELKTYLEEMRNIYYSTLEE